MRHLSPKQNEKEKKVAYDPRKFFDIIYLNLLLNFILYLFATFSHSLSRSSKHEKGVMEIRISNC